MVIKHFIILTALTFIWVIPETAWTASRSTIPGNTDDDLQAACNASLNACVDACQRGYADRPDTKRRCIDNCEVAYSDCITSISLKKNKKSNKKDQKGTLGN